jgi:hypothetical protein
MAIGPVPFINATSLVNTPEPQSQSHLQDDIQKTNAQISSSGSAAMAVQAFMAFQPDVQPIASLNPANETQQALPVEANDDFNGSTPEWTGAVVDVYA